MEEQNICSSTDAFYYALRHTYGQVLWFPNEDGGRDALLCSLKHISAETADEKGEA